MTDDEAKFSKTRSKLRQLKHDYKSLRDDYEILKQNMQANVREKKTLRNEIDKLTKEYRALKQQLEPKKINTENQDEQNNMPTMPNTE
jgi:predicted nuclease with TOPRIM domain